MPCLTNAEIASIISAIDAVHEFLNQHVDITSGASRFGELTAFFQNDLIGGLIPCGKVEVDQDSIAIGRIRLQDLEAARSALMSATPDVQESTGDTCQDIVNAINNISVDWSKVSPYVQIEVNKLIPTLTNNIETVIFNQISVLADYDADILTGINNITTKLNSVSNNYSSVYSLLNSRTIEILERIHDTRTELKQSANRIIQIWNCLMTDDATVDNPTCKPMDIDIELVTSSILESLLIFFNPLFNIESSIRLFLVQELEKVAASLEVSIEAAITSCCSLIDNTIKQQVNLAITTIIADVNTPDWLASVTTTLSNITASIGNLYNFLELLKIELKAAINGIAVVTQEGDVVNNYYSNTNNFNTNEIVNNPVSFDSVAILTALSNLQGIAQSISQCVCIEFTGNVNLTGCTDDSTKLFPFSGKGLDGISRQVAATASAINEIGKRTCNSSNIAALMPSDKYRELDCDRQIVIYFGLNYPYLSGSTWYIKMPYPRRDLSWLDFEDWVWKKGLYTHSVRFSLDGTTWSRKNATWGAFESRDHGIEFFDRALKLLEPSIFTIRNNGDGKISKRSPSAEIKCVRAIVVSIDNESGRVIESYCYAPPS